MATPYMQDSSGKWKALALAAALATAYAAGHYRGTEQGWQAGFASSSAQWQKITASITNNADDEQEETDDCADASIARSR